MRFRHVLLASILLFGFAIAGCGGGSGGSGGGTPPIFTPAPTASPSGAPTAVPIPSAPAFRGVLIQSPLLPNASSQSVALPSASGFSGSVQLPPSNSSGVSLAETITNQTPGGSVPALDVRRFAQSVRGTRSATASIIAYLGIYPTAPLALPSIPGFTLTLPSPYIVPGANYYVALYDQSRPSLGWQLDFEGPAAVSGATLTFAGSTTPYTFGAFFTYWFALIAVPASGAQPTPAPQISPIPVPTQPPLVSPIANMHQTFNDDFNGASGAPVDAAKWKADVGPWSDNQELEYYANVTNPSGANFDSKYAHQDGLGHLVVSAYRENPTGATCWYGSCQYTSARLTTNGLFSQSYGRIEASIKIPQGQGLWPAFWLGDTTASWPNSAELDAMEAIGSAPATVYGAAHGPGFNSGGPITVFYTLPVPQKLADGFHLYAIDWEQNAVRYYIDDTLYATITPANIPPGGQWLFGRPFYLILNLAVGGSFPGSPDATTPFPAQMQIDYVRVYQY